MVVFKDRSIHLCKHCGIRCASDYCNQCKKAEGRKEMDTWNKKFYKEQGKEWICKMCNLGWYSVFSKTFKNFDEKFNG